MPPLHVHQTLLGILQLPDRRQWPQVHYPDLSHLTERCYPECLQKVEDMIFWTLVGVLCALLLYLLWPLCLLILHDVLNIVGFTAVGVVKGEWQDRSLHVKTAKLI